MTTSSFLIFLMGNFIGCYQMASPVDTFFQHFNNVPLSDTLLTKPWSVTIDRMWHLPQQKHTESNFKSETFVCLL